MSTSTVPLLPSAFTVAVPAVFLATVVPIAHSCEESLPLKKATALVAVVCGNWVVPRARLNWRSYEPKVRIPLTVLPAPGEHMLALLETSDRVSDAEPVTTRLPPEPLAGAEVADPPGELGAG
jgi:hypothetical protein